MCGDRDRDRGHFAAASASQQGSFHVRPPSTTSTAFFSREAREAVMEVQGGIERLLGMYRAGVEAEAALRAMGIDPNNPNKGTEQTTAKREARQLSKGDQLDGQVIGVQGANLKVKLDGTGGNYVATIHQRDRGTLRIGARVRVIVSHVYAPRQRTTKVDLDLVGVLPR